jgi:flavin-dependent dehydrogenase
LIANRLQLKEFYPDLKKAAIWGYFDGGLRLGGGNPEVTCILHTASRDAWFWYIPLHDGTISVGLVGDNDFLLKRGGSPQETFETEMKDCPGVQRRLLDARLTSRYYVAKEFSYMTRQQSGDGWVLVGDAGGFIDPIYSSGVFLALKSAVWAAESVIDGLHRDDLSAEMLGRWTGRYEEGVNLIRKLVRAFYVKEFSFASFVNAHPEHAAGLTNLLIGRVFEGNPGAVFDDLDPWLAGLRSETPVAAAH